jgi:hypothetical protein
MGHSQGLQNPADVLPGAGLGNEMKVVARARARSRSWVSPGRGAADGSFSGSRKGARRPHGDSRPLKLEMDQDVLMELARGWVTVSSARPSEYLRACHPAVPSERLDLGTHSCNMVQSHFGVCRRATQPIYGSRRYQGGLRMCIGWPV